MRSSRGSEGIGSIRLLPAVMLAAPLLLAAAPAFAAPPPICVDPGADLVHHWRGDGDATDSAGDVDGTLSGATFTTGRFGQAFSFDGIDDFVTFGNSAGNFGSADFTVSYWISTLNSTEHQGVLGKRVTCVHGSFWESRITVAGTMSVELDQDAGANNYNSLNAPAPLNDGAFHLLTFTRQGPTLRIFVDGDEIASNATSGTTVLSNAANLTAGKSICLATDGTQPFTGALDDIRIYDRALTQCEIQASIASGLDVDADGDVEPLTDMLLILRHQFGLTGAALANGAVGEGCVRCEPEAISVYLSSADDLLDVDGDGEREPLTDGLLFIRYAFGFRGDTLIASPVDLAGCSHCDAMEIEAQLDPLFP